MEQLGYDNIHLAIMAIEKGARQLNVSPKDMYLRLKKQGLIHNFLLPYYEELHTQRNKPLMFFIHLTPPKSCLTLVQGCN